MCISIYIYVYELKHSPVSSNIAGWDMPELNGHLNEKSSAVLHHSPQQWVPTSLNQLL